MKQSGRTALAAGASNNNVIAGFPFEFVPVMAQAHFGFYGGDLAGITTGDIEVDVIAGGETLALNDLPTALGAVGRMPVMPDDFHLTALLAAGDRLIIRARNLDGANAAVLYWTVVLNPL